MGIVRQAIHTDQAPKAIGPYSQAIRANGFIFLSGQTPIECRIVEPCAGQFGSTARIRLLPTTHWE